MGLKCRISYNSNGSIEVTNEAGQGSALFNNLLSYTGDQNKALDYWTIANDPQFLGTGENTTISSIESYLDSQSFDSKRMSPGDMFAVKSFMEDRGIDSLDKLNTILSEIFKPNGVLDIDINVAVESGLFTQQDIQDLDVNKLNEVLNMIEGHLSVENFSVTPSEIEMPYLNPSKKTIFGTSQLVSQKEVDTDIINEVENFNSEQSFLDGLANTPYTEIYERAQEDPEYLRELMSRFSGLRKVPVLSYFNGELRSGNNETLITVKNTALDVQGDLTIESEIEYLDSIPESIWMDNAETVGQVLREIEESLIEYNIDVIGLSNMVDNRAGVMELLVSADRLVKDVNNQTIEGFATAYDSLFGTTEATIPMKVDNRYSGYNIVSVFSNFSESQLFNNDGLMKIGENLYHKVDQNADINSLREFLYEEFIEGNIEIPSEFVLVNDYKNPVYKTDVLEGISRYLMSQEVPSGVSNPELFSAYRIAFGHQAQPQDNSAVRGLERLKTDPEYLKTDFISDFYQYMLKEKLKDSDVYNRVLSKFRITDRDITLIDTVESLDGIEMRQELEDYFKIHKDSSVKELVDTTGNMLTEDMLTMNFPDIKSEYEGQFVQQGDFILAPESNNLYIKVGGELYRKGSTKPGTDLFVKVIPNTDNTYYTTGFDFSYDKKSGEELLNSIDFLDKSKVDLATFEEAIAKSRISDNMSPELKSLSTLKDKSYKIIPEGESFVAIKDGKEVGRITFKKSEDVFTDPQVFVQDKHRGKGIATELYLNLFDKALEADMVVQEPNEMSKADLNIFSRVTNSGLKELVIGGQPNILYQQNDRISVPETSPKEIFDAIIVRLESTGLSSDKVVTDRSKITKKLREINRRYKTNTRFSDIHGFLDEGVVYINPSNLNVNTPIHEFAHLWYQWADVTSPELTTKGRELIKGTPYYDSILNSSKNPNSVYYNYTEEKVLEEALVSAIGDRGEAIIEEAKKSEFRRWLDNLWDKIRRALGLSQMTKEQLEKLSLKEFLDAVNIDLLSGNVIQPSIQSEIGLSGISVEQAVERNGGFPMNRTSTGEFSTLYNDILKLPQIKTEAEADRFKAQIYSDNFKSWFGDWQNDPNNSSMVVDNKGEPLLVYHGGPESITVFDEAMGAENTGNNDYGAFYFSDQYEVAEDYGEQSIIRKYESAGQNKEDLMNFYDLTEQEAESILDDLPAYAMDNAVVHPVFLNIRQPMEVEYEGGDIDIQGAQKQIGFIKHKIDEDYEFLDYYDTDIEDYEDEINEKIEEEGVDRDEAIEMVKDENYIYPEPKDLDGLVMRQVIDSIGWKSQILQDEFVAIDPKQIKSLFNEGSFSQYHSDIRMRENSTMNLIKFVKKGNQVENISSIFNSQLELLDLYSSKEEVEIYHKINDCG